MYVKQNISPEIVNHVKTNILPRYDANDAGHGTAHIDYVLRRSLMFAANLPTGTTINLDMVFLIATYHDLGVGVDRSRHEILSAQYVREDPFLAARFAPDQIETIAQAVEDHRGSCGHEPRSIYGKIVSTADRMTDMNLFLCRMFESRRKRFLAHTITMDQIETESMEHLTKKYAVNGYGRRRSYFHDPEFIAFCDEAERLNHDWNAFVTRFRAANQIEA